MTDRVPLGNGRNLMVKAATLPSTYAEFKNTAESGALYIDLNHNDNLDTGAGCSEIGSPLNTSTLLANDTCTLLNLTTEATPNNAFVAIGNELNVVNNVTFSVSDWTASGAGWQAVKTVTGITANSKPIPSLAYSQPLNEAQCKAESKAYGRVRKLITGNGSITAQASLKPASSFTIQLRGI